VNFKKLLYDVIIVGFATGNGHRTIGREKQLRKMEAYRNSENVACVSSS
jgi:hypothetical protein